MVRAKISFYPHFFCKFSDTAVDNARLLCNRGKPKGVDAWELKYQELRQYISEFGNPNVPTKFPDNRALGRWVSTQRHMWKKCQAGEPFNNLPSEEIERRINLLNELGFSWSMIPTSESDDSHKNSHSQ